MTALILTIEPNKKRTSVRLRIPAGSAIAPELRQVHIDYGRTSRTYTRQPESALVVEFASLNTTARMSIDFGGPMPAGVLMLPEQVTGIDAPLPVLADDATGQLSSVCTIWHPDVLPVQLDHVVSSLFAHNTHLRSLKNTFAGLTALTSVPEALFFPLIYVSSFERTFAGSGIGQVHRQLFAANLQAADFTGCFEGCKALTHVPEDLLGVQTQAHIFDRMFADSALASIPAKLFAHTRAGGSFVQTFARTPIKSVPAGLFAGLDPRDVDGLVEPAHTIAHDPMHLLSAPKFAPDFFEATVSAAGVPTKAQRAH